MNESLLSYQGLHHDFTAAVTKNQILKTRILFYLFLMVFVIQSFAISSMLITKYKLIEFLSPKLLFIAPLYLLSGALCEFFYLRKLKAAQIGNLKLSDKLVYIVTVLEISFPTIILLIALNIIGNNGNIPAHEILNSPPFIFYFILIILSAFNLNRNLSILAGLTAALEYTATSSYFKMHYSDHDMLWINIALKSLFVFVCGIVTAFVSEKIRVTMLESLDSQHKLIHKLDLLVDQKTEEISKQKSKIEKQHQELSLKNNEIVDSINYASRIQFTLLANAEYLRDHLPQHFIYYQPKDIVSGDYYWASKKGSLFYLAVCDSTGHGVPGAFMSLLNITFLNEAINQRNILEPDRVFNFVREKLIEQISKEGQKDGFDGILICFDLKNQSFTYAAANNSPLIIRKGEILELNKDRMPVGQSEKMVPFVCYKFDYQKDDCLYLYTDGFADQFGGVKGKKFKYKQLIELLQNINSLDQEEQKLQLKQVFQSWKGKLEQVDDVCIIGMRL